MKFKIIAFVLLFLFAVGCSTNHYIYDQSPTLHLVENGRWKNFYTLKLVISNPTSQRKHFLVSCELSSGQKIEQRVVINPRSDKLLYMSLPLSLENWNCYLKKDCLPGSQK